MDTTLEFRILGPLEVLGDAGLVHVGSAKQRALLGTLLLYPNETVSMSGLVDAIWGERPPATAEKLVHEAHKVCPYSKATRNNIDVKLAVAD